MGSWTCEYEVDTSVVCLVTSFSRASLALLSKDENDVVKTISEPSGEGIADIYAALRLNDSCIGRGFYIERKCLTIDDKCLECTGVREIDYHKMRSNQPHTLSWSREKCGHSVHCLGLVYSEAIWSLYKEKLSKYYGYDSNTSLEIVTRLTYVAAGKLLVFYVSQLYTPNSDFALISIVGHVSTWYSDNGGCDSGSGYLNYLIADDDDGDLQNGTPHMMAIYEAFDEQEIACATPKVQDSGCIGSSLMDSPIVTAVPGSKEISLSWNKILGAVAYEVFRTEGSKGCDMGKIKLTETTSTSFKDEGLRDGREYFYIIIPKGAIPMLQSLLPYVDPILTGLFSTFLRHRLKWIMLWPFITVHHSVSSSPTGSSNHMPFRCCRHKSAE
jgi:hypothetical protein